MILILKYIILTAIRDRFYLSLFIILGITFGISSLLSHTALVEKEIMAIIYFSSFSRVICAIGMILFICIYISRSFESKEIEFILSKPISRNKIILSYLFSFFIISITFIIPIYLILLLLKSNIEGSIYWLASFALEILIIICFSIISSLILEKLVSSILACLSFYFISRMMGFFIMATKIPENFRELLDINNMLQIILKSISLVFPRIDLFTQSKWLLNGLYVENFSSILVQSFIYTILLLLMSLYDFEKKQF